MANAASLDEVRALFQARKAELIAQYHAEGAGIGKGPGGEYEIVVYLAEEKARPIERAALEGVPIRFEVTGKFQPQ